MGKELRVCVSRGSQHMINHREEYPCQRRWPIFLECIESFLDSPLSGEGIPSHERGFVIHEGG